MIKKERKKKGTNNHQVKTKRVRSVLFVLKEGFLFLLRGNNTLGQGTLAAEKPQAQSHSRGQPPSQLGTSGQSTTGNSPCWALAGPGHRGASRGVPRPALPPVLFLLKALKTTYQASTRCPCFTLTVPVPPQTLHHGIMSLILKLKEHISQESVFCQNGKLKLRMA